MVKWNIFLSLGFNWLRNALLIKWLEHDFCFWSGIEDVSAVGFLAQNRKNKFTQLNVVQDVSLKLVNLFRIKQQNDSKWCLRGNQTIWKKT